MTSRKKNPTAKKIPWDPDLPVTHTELQLLLEAKKNVKKAPVYIRGQ